MTNSEQSVSPPIKRADSIDDQIIRLKLRRSAFAALVGDGMGVSGRMQLVDEGDGTYSICVWSVQMPDWPDPVPGNAAAAAEKRSRRK